MTEYPYQEYGISFAITKTVPEPEPAPDIYLGLRWTKKRRANWNDLHNRFGATVPRYYRTPPMSLLMTRAVHDGRERILANIAQNNDLYRWLHDGAEQQAEATNPPA